MYSLRTSKKLHFAFRNRLLNIVVSHISKSFLHTFNGGYIFVELLDNILFSNITSKSTLLEINFIKEKATYLDQK